MNESLEEKCRKLINANKFEQCEKEIVAAMASDPHWAIPHNLMGILMEKENNHVLAMKHFRVANDLDPTYIPARYNMQNYGEDYPLKQLAYSDMDCLTLDDDQFKIVYDKKHIGHLVRK